MLPRRPMKTVTNEEDYDKQLDKVAGELTRLISEKKIVI